MDVTNQTECLNHPVLVTFDFKDQYIYIYKDSVKTRKVKSVGYSVLKNYKKHIFVVTIFRLTPLSSCRKSMYTATFYTENW